MLQILLNPPCMQNPGSVELWLTSHGGLPRQFPLLSHLMAPLNHPSVERGYFAQAKFQQLPAMNKGYNIKHSEYQSIKHVIQKNYIHRRGKLVHKNHSIQMDVHQKSITSNRGIGTFTSSALLPELVLTITPIDFLMRSNSRVAILLATLFHHLQQPVSKQHCNPLV